MNSVSTAMKGCLASSAQNLSSSPLVVIGVIG
jgi:hypothetical protein